MTNTVLQDSMVRAFGQLSIAQQVKLLGFIKSLLAHEQDAKPNALLKYAGTWAAEDIHEMREAVEDCGNVDIDGW